MKKLNSSKKLKVLLTQPPWCLDEFCEQHLLTFPAGIMSIAAFIQHADIELKVYYEKKYTCESFKEFLLDFNPDVIGFSCISPNFFSCMRLSQVAKGVDQNIQIVLGGYHATFLHEGILNNVSTVDFIVRGEGEETFLELINRISQKLDVETLKKVRGISFRANNRIYVNLERKPMKSLDAIPLFPFNLLSMENIDLFEFLEDNVKYIFASRGCSHDCSFCSSSNMWGRRCRFKSVAKVLKEMEECEISYGSRKIFLLDPTFTADKNRIHKLCQELILRKKRYNWVCNTRIDSVDEPLLKHMKEAGCVKILYGVESLSKKMLNLTVKKYTVENIIKILNYTNRIGIISRANFILGYPGENESTLSETRSNLKKLSKEINFQVNLFELYSGSSIYQYFKSKQFISDDIWYQGFRPRDFIFRIFSKKMLNKIYELKNYIESNFINA